MPAIIRPQPDKVGTNTDAAVQSSADLLDQTSVAWCLRKPVSPYTQTNKRAGPEDRPVLRHSFGDLDASNTSSSPRPALVPFGNGFVDGILRAFQQDLHLVLRPDDVWLAALTQFSFYVNGHAEELRGSFVAHAGKETLVVDVTPATIQTVDVGAFARAMTGLMGEYLVEPGVRDWLVPEFSTTTDADRSVAAMVMMSTMKSYFEYVMMVGCGFPSVTLEGTKADWEDLRVRVQRFAKYGEEPKEWCGILDKVLEYMVAGFHRPEDKAIKDFWMRACYSAGWEGSGGVYSLSGWITAFCFWDEEGNKIRQYSDDELNPAWMGASEVERKRLFLDGVEFPIIRRKEIPKAVADVPVIVMDLQTGTKINTTLVAGSVGMMATKSASGLALDTFQPRSGWWMLFDSSEPMT